MVLRHPRRMQKDARNSQELLFNLLPFRKEEKGGNHSAFVRSISLSFSVCFQIFFHAHGVFTSPATNTWHTQVLISLNHFPARTSRAIAAQSQMCACGVGGGRNLPYRNGHKWEVGWVQGEWRQIPGGRSSTSCLDDSGGPVLAIPAYA